MEDIHQQIESIMNKVAVLPAAERQLLLDKIKRSVDRTEAICSGKQLNVVPNSSNNDPTPIGPPQTKTLSQSKTLAITLQRKSCSSVKRRPATSGAPTSITDAVPSKSQLTLACPVCDLKASSWQKFSQHLHTGHSQSSVTSVCRRCHGMFRNHALLLAHECFRWGRTNLPCAAVYSSIEDSPILNDFGFPREGVYLERRCGLCLTSDVVYSNFEQYERHKYEEHAESGSRAPICDIQRPQNKSFQAPASALIASKPRRRARKSKSENLAAFQKNGNHNNSSDRAEEPTPIAVGERDISSVQGIISTTSTTRVFSCHVCKLFFRTRDRLLRHEKTSIVHDRRLSRSKRFKLAPVPESALGRPFECAECGLVYTRKHALERHVAFAHNGETAFRCEFCSFHALDRANFRQHMSRHFHLKNFACEHCDHRCITKQELEDHVRFKHSDKRDFKCPDCQATFKTPGTLSRHQKTHTNISFLCNQCDASFNRMSNLKRHKDSVHSATGGNRRGRGRPQKTTRQKQQRKAILQQQPEQDQQPIPVSSTTAAEPLWDYEPTRVHSTTGDQLCAPVTTTTDLEPVYVVAFETEAGWIPATTSTATITEEGLIVHHPPPPPQPPPPPPPHTLAAPRGDTVLPCVSDFFSSFLPPTSPSTQLDDHTVSPPPPPPQTPSGAVAGVTSHPPTTHLWRSDEDVDDLGTTSAVPADDLICDFLNCGVVGAEEDVEGTGAVGVGGNNFSVGYLIGGGGAEGSGGGGGGGGERGEELHTLPPSDCLSLVPIVTSAFEETNTTSTNVGVNVSSTFHPFWSVSCTTAAGAADIVHQDYSGFEQQEVGDNL
ncbi:Histone-lysine N-methyltransferase PRDM16 [Taenia crassiceps]|uniref:Histone-lysine N-methyltransferase PRDM16 n=1 Tax=Taenia crassiceps TaxID=6207 RepID=A0ABR4QPN0_9CEST